MHTTEPLLTQEQLQRVIEANPFGQWLQLQVVSVNDQGVTLLLPGRAELVGTQALQRLHGGAVSSLVDVACGYAVLVRSGRIVSTLSLHTDFHRAAPLGELRVEGRVLHQGGRIATAESFIRDGSGALIASGRCTIYQNRDMHRSAP